MRRALLATALLGACASPPPLPKDAESLLAEAEQRLQAKDFPGSLALLETHAVGDLPKALRPRYLLALARTQKGLGEPWDAFQTIRNFADDYPHSELRDQVVDLEFEVGDALARSKAGFLFFSSDRSGGRTVLEHMITRYPDTVHLADALHILGEMAYEDGDYDKAKERYLELMRRRPESEWVPLARFRFAMSIVASLRGPEYDLDQMQHATKELADFLANPPEKPEFVAAAQEAMKRLLQWQAERHLMIARFYRKVGNRAGEVEQLRQAIAPELAATESAARARARLVELGEAVPPGGGQP